jgi:hypothetical protein
MENNIAEYLYSNSNSRDSNMRYALYDIIYHQ